MKLSKKIQAMDLSPIRKFVPYADAARAAGKKVYGLNIGQPDIKTPRAFFDAVKNFDQEVLAYANSQGEKSLIEALIGYYKRIGIEFENKDILITNGGSEALSMIFTGILDEGDEVSWLNLSTQTIRHSSRLQAAKLLQFLQLQTMDISMR